MGIFCQLCLSIQASALGYTYDLASLCGGLHTRKRNGCSSRTRRIDKISHRSRVAAIHSISVQSKASEAFVQPLKLLPSTPANYSLTTSLEEELHSLSDFSQTLYRVELITSNDSSSDLSDTNAGILVCIIGENGNSIIQRFPAILPTSQVFSSDMSEIVQQNCNRLHFQRGSVDGLTFWGPDIGKLVAIWIGPESGSWRLSRVSVLVIPPSQRVDIRSDNLEKQKCENVGLYYIFQTNEVMLGDGGDSAVELRASRVQEVSGNDMWTMFQNSSMHRTMTSSKDAGKLQQESLKYYKDLKISLLLYNAILVASGTLIAAIAGNQEISNGFAIGGTFGFIYLLLLQGAVDKLPGPPSFESQSYPGSAKNNSLFQDNDISRGSRVEKQGQDMDMEYSNLSSLETKKFQDSFSGFRGPLTRLSWIIAILFLTSKYASGKVMITLKPQELLAGAAGFLTCKVAAVMASFRTIAIDCKDHKK
ncbi:uncharacterized protein LOC131036642 [Cryptomeria japonica]|uniref:uncharacterized protein LOC131036642 n=1 Tax=Cryptomeria japonica TaxID=3369 RepID=UPI0027DA232B|nr:uncharacterized protein LOC131036642 [Cryptomeria japonica]